MSMKAAVMYGANDVQVGDVAKPDSPAGGLVLKIMNCKYPNLFSPIKIGNVILKNRIISAPTGMMDLTPDGRLTPYNIAYYELKALGGAGVVTLGESIIDSKTGKSHNRQISLDNPDSLPCLTRTVRAIQQGGALANIELSHGGKYGGLVSLAGDIVSPNRAYGPSAEILSTGEHVYEMTKDMIMDIVASYGRAAKLCLDAGFDMVMVHAAHGWLFNQFLSPLENMRTDEFGGCFENRARFLMLALDEVRRVVGKDFPIELRMNGDDFIAGAMNEQDYIQLAKLVESKVNLINVSCGSHEAERLFVRTHPSMFLDHGCNVYLAAGIKKVVKIPVACVGGVHSPELAEEIISTGKADIVELGRALLADPYFPKKAMLGEQDDINPCIRCFACLEGNICGTVIRCTVNPVIGSELDEKYYNPKPQKKKNVLVIGGGPGGMQAAIAAAKKGHQVTLCEQSDRLGGALAFAESIPFKRELYDYAMVLERRVYKENIVVELNKKVDANYIKSKKTDVVIAAIGAKPTIPPIAGIENKNVLLAAECESNMQQVGNEVVIVGGGLIGCELGVHLGMNGKHVTILEMREELAPDANRLHKMALDIQLEKYIHGYTSTTVTSIDHKGVHAKDSSGKEVFVEADTVIIATGMKTDIEYLYTLSGESIEFYPIGDCAKVGQVLQAVNQGYFIAREL